jgi:hypothetical protein
MTPQLWNHQRIASLCRLVLLLTLGLVAGCARQTVVEGKVRYRGAEVPGGTLIFLTPDGKEFSAVVSSTGSYRFESPFTGSAKVLYQKPALPLAPAGTPPPGVQVPGEAGPLAAVPAKTLKKYGDSATTDLSVTITSGHQLYNAELTDPNGKGVTSP